MRGRTSERKPIRDPSRHERYQSFRAALLDTPVGREFDLRRLDSFADFQASVPLFDVETHTAKVTTRLGFDSAERSDAELAAAERDRAELVAIWQARFGSTQPPRRIALLHARADEPVIDRMRLGDLATLGPNVEILRIDRLDATPDPQIELLRRFRPDTLVVPSLAVCAWLETQLRAPLERLWPELRWLMAEADLDQRLRSRMRVINGGWLHASGRIGLPTRRSPWQGFSLATRTSLIELLAAVDPELDAHDRLAGRQCVLPEHAVVGERYELVVSSALGFVRLRTGLHVRVVGFVAPAAGGADSLVRPRVLRLPPPPGDLALEGVTLAGAPLTASVRQAFQREDPALVAGEVTAIDRADGDVRHAHEGLESFGETELGASRVGLVRRGPRPKGVLVRVEVQGQMDLAFSGRLARRIDEDLRRRSAAYDWLRGRDELEEARVLVAEHGTTRRTREQSILALDGPVEQPIVRVRTRAS